MDIRKEVKGLMKAKEMNMRELSDSSGVSYSSIQRYLSNSGDLSSENFLLILKSIDLDISELFTEDSFVTKFKAAPEYIKKSLIKIVGG